MEWNPGTLAGVLANERHCGDVLARKTFTPNFLTHKSKKNNNDRTQYRQKNHHKEKSEENENMKNYKIAVAGTGYVGLSLSVLLAQHNQVMAVDIVQAKVDMINNHKSPIQDDYIEKYTGRRKTHDEREKTEPDDPEAA